VVKEAYYFSHDANARQDEKILMLRAEHGWEGYGIYWALVEMMFESSDTALNHNKIKGIAVSYNIDITLLQSVINTCLTEELFTGDDDKFWSESLKRRKSKYHDTKSKKSEAGKKGMAKRWGEAKNDNTVITENNKGKESKGNESKEINIKDIAPNGSRFKKPSLEEVMAYCEERKNGVEAERWFDHYTSNGWMVGKSPMKDWKSAVRTWERNSNGKSSVGKSGYAAKVVQMQPNFNLYKDDRNYEPLSEVLK
jgi:hypothetical protein